MNRKSSIPGCSLFSTVLLTTLVAVWTPAAPAGGQCEYEVTILPNVPCFGADAVPRPWAINDNGEVAGSFDLCASSSEGAFYWSQETGLIILNMPEGTTDSEVNDINNNGQIVGEYSNTNCEQGFMGFLVDGDEFTCLGTLRGGTNSVAHAINDNGVITGWWGNTVTGPSPLAFVWEDGAMMDLSVPIGGLRNEGFDIVEASSISGWRQETSEEPTSILFSNGKLTEIDNDPGEVPTKAFAVNDSNQAAGIRVVFSQDTKSLVTRATRWSDGMTQELQILDGHFESWARDINNQGVVVGESEGDADIQAAKWLQDTIVDLNEAIITEEPMVLGRAYSINNHGQITATGAMLPPQDGIAVVLTPVNMPEADLTGDCQVDVEDLLVLLQAWETQNSIADINGDLIVNVSDLLALLSDWTS